MTGRVVRPADPDFGAVRAGFNAMIDRRPAAIVRVRTDADVAVAIAWAREHEPPLAIRAGGHLAPGFCTCEDGIVIDVRELGQADVDPQGAIRCGSGLTWREFDAVTQQYGLERAMGLTSDRLGGGHGW